MPATKKLPQRSVLIETVLASIVFSMLLFATFDFGRMYYYQSKLQRAVAQSSRFATTGNTLDDPDKPGVALSREDSIVHMIKMLSGISDLAPADVQIASMTRTGTLVPGVGGPGDVVTVSVHYRVNVLAPFLHAVFPGGQYEFTASTTFRNDSVAHLDPAGAPVNRRASVPVDTASPRPRAAGA